MYKLIEKKDGVGIYYPFKNKILANTKDGLVYDNKIILKPKKNYISDIKVLNDFVYVFEYYGGLSYFNINNIEEIKEKDFIPTIGIFISENDVIYSHYSDDYLLSYKTRINLTTNQKKWTIESYFGNGVIFENHLFASCTNNRICKIDLDNPEHPLWHFNLNQLGTYRQAGDDLTYEVVQFIGIWQSKLLVQLTNARLLALDINTGELLQDIEINKTNPLTTAFYDQYIKMHLVDDKIIWLTNQTLLHIDLNTFTVRTIKEFYSPPRENQWRFMHSTFHKGKIYFTADYAWQYVTPSYVGVMDAQTGEVLWSEQLENTGGLPEAPKVTDDKLYIRTNNRVLHIFEKEPTPTL